MKATTDAREAANRLQRAYDEITCDLSPDEAQWVREEMRDFFDSEDDREGADEEE
jgi:hypothetical protein